MSLRLRRVVALLLALTVAPTGAAVATGDDLLRAHSLTTAPVLPAGDQPRPDPRAAAIAERVPALFAGMRERAQQAAARRATMKSAAAQVGGGAAALEVHLRPGIGTPMLLRDNAPPSGGAALLQSDESAARAFLRAHREVIGLDDIDAELQLESQSVDALARRHLRFAQMHAGLPVWPGEVMVHLDAAGAVDSVNGAYVPSPRQVSHTPRIDAVTALDKARAVIAGGASATASAPELIIYAPLRKKARLAWLVELEVSLAERWLVVIDAQRGRKLLAFNQVPRAAEAGTGADLFGASQSLSVWGEGGADYLVDTSKPMFDPTSDPPAPNTTRGGIVVLDARNQPPNDDPQTLPDLFAITAPAPVGPWLADGVSAAFTLSETYDYYLQRHARNSIDGAGGTMIAVVRLGQNLLNAFWTNGLMLFGDGQRYAGGLDVTAHEMTHGVTELTANLIYQDQPGAANEAFSDIFGENVEAYSSGHADWLKGAQIVSPIQNYADCGSVLYQPGRPYPSRMSEYINTAHDNGGVHGNSCIINHAYYLLAEGLAGAIGIADAEKIFYRALTTHLVRNSQFVDVRLASVLSAEELFGAGSAQAAKTGEAFDAVEIFDGMATPPPPEFPGVNGPDATVYVYYDSDADDFFLGRREIALGDPDDGTSLSGGAVKAARPSVTGDGTVAVFVSADDDGCMIPTNAEGDTFEDCLDAAGTVYSVSISPDGKQLAFVLQDEDGNPQNSISVVDTVSGTFHTFPLRAPLVDGETIGTVLFAEVMDFTADGNFLLYDAFDQIDLGGGATRGFYSVYALDLVNDRTLELFNPKPGVDVGNPSLAQTSDNFLVVDIVDNGAGHVVAVDLTTGDPVDLAAITGSSFPVGVPGYSGDDEAVIYTQADTNTELGLSLLRQSMTDRETPNGAPTLWMSDASYGVIYRRGTFTGPGPTPTPTRVPTATTTPTPAACVGDCDSSGQIDTGEIDAGINAALSGSLTGVCASLNRNEDAVITVDELISAVVGRVFTCVSPL